MRFTVFRIRFIDYAFRTGQHCLEVGILVWYLQSTTLQTGATTTMLGRANFLLALSSVFGAVAINSIKIELTETATGECIEISKQLRKFLPINSKKKRVSRGVCVCESSQVVLL